MKENILSVSALNNLSREILESCLQVVWVEGEVSNLSQPTSGHCYFSLKDHSAQVRCALFKFTRARISHNLANGTRIVVQAKVSLYEARGDYQLIVSDFYPAGEGLLQQQFLALKKKLQEKGLFEEAHKKPIPRLPQQIGIITSSTGAAVQDILTVLKRRFPAIPVIIYPTLVQGNEAAATIAEAIKLANLRQECDVLLLARGGGSLEDLWPFNEEVVAHAIFNSTIPIVSGVGHEVDITIADLVADLRAATPSAAAEHAVPDQVEIQQQFTYCQRRLQHLIQGQLQHAQTLLMHTSKRLQHPAQKLKQLMQQLDELETRLFTSIRWRLHYKKQQLQMLARSLNTISPLNTLERGYAILLKAGNGDIIRSTTEVQIEERVVGKLKDGEIVFQVIEKKQRSL